MKRILTAIAVLFAACATVFAQGGYQVKGVVKDAMGPVIGATVMEQGTTNGTTTGLDGDFILTVSNANAVVEISCIGYATQSFTASAVPATILLAEDAEFLDEVVVIGYGTVKKSDLTGSVSTVKADEINRGAINSPEQMLMGKVAGLLVTPPSGSPGESSTIRIRGAASLNASNDPLIVIDGVPITPDGGAGMGNPLASVNPNDIESYSVLKDASATAIYGSRASNGVIIITTKKGSKFDDKVHVDVDLTASLSQNTKYVDVLTGDEIRALMTKLYGAGSGAVNLLGTANTDWQKEIFQLARTLEGNVSVTGRAGKADSNFYMPWRVSLGYHNQDGTLQTSNLERGTVAVALTPTLFHDHLSINLNAKGMTMNNQFANAGAVGAAVKYDPTKHGRVNSNSADVLVPAFLAAYTGRDASRMNLNPFLGILKILPNWSVTFDGLGKIPWVKDHFKSVTLTHAYTCKYAIGSYGSYSTWVGSDSNDKMHGFVRDVTTDAPRPSSAYDISNVTLTEAFSPLIGLNMTMKNSLSIKAEYRKQRNLALNVTSVQLTEGHTSEFVIGGGYTIKNLSFIAKKRDGGQTKVSNDLKLQVDLSYKDVKMLLRKVEEGITQASSGNKVLAIKISADYVLSQKISLQLFYDHQGTTPLISSSYPVKADNVGLNIKLMLTR